MDQQMLQSCTYSYNKERRKKMLYMYFDRGAVDYEQSYLVGGLVVVSQKQQAMGCFDFLHSESSRAC